MKLRRIAVNNLRRFTSPVEIAGLADGLNVLSAPNEQGKSTLFDGLQALFFTAHSGKPREISALRPHAGGAPEVLAEVETPAGRFTIAKRWLSRPRALIHQDGRLIAQADEAEAWIARLAAADAGGPAGLLWVKQGLTALSDGSKKELDTQREARRDLLSSVAGEVEAMTGGQRMDAALKRCREELDAYATGTGKPRTGGPWKAAQDRVAALQETRDRLAATVGELQEALAARTRARNELTEIESPDAIRRRKERLAEAAEAHAAAERHADELDRLTRAVDTARLRRDSLKERLEALQEARVEFNSADAQAQATRAAQMQTETALEGAEAAASAGRTALEAARQALTQADARLQHAQRAARIRESAGRRAELVQRLSQAEELTAQARAAQPAASKGPTAKEIQRLETLAAQRDQQRALQEASAAHLTITYAAGAEGAVRQMGVTLPDGTSHALVTETTLQIANIGELTFTPGAGASTDALTRAEDALAEALSRLDLPDLDQARAAAQSRAEAERRLAETRAALQAIAPKGLDALRDAIAVLPAPEDIEDAPPVDQAEEARAQAETARISAESAFEAARERYSAARTDAAHAQSDARAAADRLARAQAALARLQEAGAAELVETLGLAETALTDAIAAREQAAAEAPDLETTAAALSRAQSAERAAEDQIRRLHPEIARLDERISRGSEGAVEEQLEEAEQALKTEQATLARITRDVAVLKRLQEALETARSAARDRYFTPVANALRPLLHLLWPEAQLEWDDTDLLPSGLIRDGQQEPIDVLSGGTQEQLALLVRLAFARLLSQDGRTAPVILDDALVYTDDDRIERMFDALHRQAGDVQILVLTCRQRAFRDLGGRQLHIAPLDLAGQDSLLRD
ncbi:AAA family ATPase [Antarctobacter jejuensis]|uniref:AAA family ATPase n=1 Tax=Antarctobacter jejuensis TaxID=1439938 RepID=UPI003FD00475